MVSLKKYNIGDEILTNKWNSPFYVEVIYKGYVVAVNKKSKMWVFLFIKTYTGEIFYGSSRFLKYGIKNKQDMKDFVDDIVKGNVVLEKDASTSYELLLDRREFDSNEKRNQVSYK